MSNSDLTQEIRSYLVDLVELDEVLPQSRSPFIFKLERDEGKDDDSDCSGFLVVADSFSDALDYVAEWMADTYDNLNDALSLTSMSDPTGWSAVAVGIALTDVQYGIMVTF